MNLFPQSRTPAGSGITRQQMLSAPYRSLFIWWNDNPSYPKALASHIGRNDLYVEPFSALKDYPKYHGFMYGGLVLDHRCQLSPSDHVELSKFRSCVRPWAVKP